MVVEIVVIPIKTIPTAVRFGLIGLEKEITIPKSVDMMVGIVSNSTKTIPTAS